MRRNDLHTAIHAIDFIPIVFSGIMRGGNHDAAHCFKMFREEGSIRGRAQLTEIIHLDPSREKHACSNVRENIRIMTGVVRNYDTVLALLREILLDITQKSLRRLHDDNLVHAAISWRHFSTKTSCPKLKAVGWV